MMKNLMLMSAILAVGLTACGSVAETPATQTPAPSTLIDRVLPLDVSEANGWKEVVPGYWTKTQETNDGPVTTTYIDNSSKVALKYGIEIQEGRADAKLLASQGLKNDNSYLNFLKARLNDTIVSYR